MKDGIHIPNIVEKGISDIVGVFTDPILVFPGGWGDTLPDWLKTAITLERLEEMGNLSIGSRLGYTRNASR
jgi:hypothetical protein